MSKALLKPMTKLTHLDEAGNAAMVDISAKDATVREAVAEGRIAMSAEALAAIREGAVKTIYSHYGLRYDVPQMYQ